MAEEGRIAAGRMRRKQKSLPPWRKALIGNSRSRLQLRRRLLRLLRLLLLRLLLGSRRRLAGAGTAVRRGANTSRALVRLRQRSGLLIAATGCHCGRRRLNLQVADAVLQQADLYA